jgi:hypothetical protein
LVGEETSVCGHGPGENRHRLHALRLEGQEGGLGRRHLRRTRTYPVDFEVTLEGCMVSDAGAPDEDLRTGFVPNVADSLVTQVGGLRGEVGVDGAVGAARPTRTPTLAWEKRK